MTMPAEKLESTADSSIIAKIGFVIAGKPSDIPIGIGGEKTFECRFGIWQRDLEPATGSSSTSL